MYWIIAVMYVVSQGYQNVKNVNQCTKCCIWVPVFSVFPLIESISEVGLLSLLFSSFPQYIINISFALEHNEFSTWNWISIILSLTSLAFSPAIQIIGKHEDTKFKCNLDVALHILKLFFIYLFTIVPIVLLEVVHFFPILIEYYWYQSITIQQLVNCLLWFNFPKLIFLCMQFPEEAVEVENIAVVAFVKNVPNDTLGALLGAFIFLVVFLVLPLVPIAFAIGASFYDGKGVNGNGAYNVFLLLCYLGIAYGGMSYNLFNYADGGVGDVTLYALGFTWGLAFYFPVSAMFYGLCAEWFDVESVRLFNI